jgi:hypothetical protein
MSSANVVVDSEPLTPGEAVALNTAAVPVRRLLRTQPRPNDRPWY